MSNPTAITAVTATLRNLLTAGALQDSELNDTTVSTLPPDLARDGNLNNQLNIFLYRTTINTAFSNMPMPGQVKPGETGMPSLSLVLHYLITAYGRDNNDLFGHRLMGRSMSVLHDHPLLGRDEIQASLTDTDLQNQIERIRITLDDVTLDDMSKLWTSFQTQYRLSANYQVSVVLIESTRNVRTPLPVLTRGKDDSGVRSQPDLIPPFPALTSITTPNEQPAAQLRDTITLKGHHLDGDDVKIRFRHQRLTDSIDILAESGGTSEQITVEIPDNSAVWMAGVYIVDVLVSKTGEQERSTNKLPLLVAPEVISITPNPVTLDASGEAILTITCKPEVRPEQRVSLLLGDLEILAETHTTQTNTLTFQIQGVTAGKQFARLRVDGVDSLLVDRSVMPPVFDGAMEVTIND